MLISRIGVSWPSGCHLGHRFKQCNIWLNCSYLLIYFVFQYSTFFRDSFQNYFRTYVKLFQLQLNFTDQLCCSLPSIFVCFLMPHFEMLPVLLSIKIRFLYQRYNKQKPEVEHRASTWTWPIHFPAPFSSTFSHSLVSIVTRLLAWLWGFGIHFPARDVFFLLSAASTPVLHSKEPSNQ
jgi:hypothetical protein